MKQKLLPIGIALSSMMCFTPCLAGNAQTIYGFAAAKNFSGQSGHDFYIQDRSFLSKARADQYQRLLQSKTTYPVKVEHSGTFYRVLLGPMSSAAEVRKVANSMMMSAPAQAKTIASAKGRRSEMQSNVHEHNAMHLPTWNWLSEIQPNKANWFVSVGGGEQYPQIKSPMSVDNNSGFVAPYDQDLYSTSSNGQGIIAVTAGRRWQRDNTWFPAFWAGVFYEHLFATDVGGTVTQYSLPEFTNYNYQWNISSNVVLATGKLNLVQYVTKLSPFKTSPLTISPFINGGIGIALNNASGYSETALSGVTARVSPGFANNSQQSQFAYDVGAGVDLQFMPRFIVSVGYNYQGLGHVNSGPGLFEWSGQSLNLGNYNSNNVFASLTYLFDAGSYSSQESFTK